MKLIDRRSLRYWEQYRDNVLKSTPVDLEEDVVAKQRRVKKLLKPGNETAFMAYYFPKYATADFAKFQHWTIREICENPTIFLTAAFSRDHAKSVLLMMIIILLYRRGELKNLLLVSYNKDNAEELLAPLRIQLESNQRLINDFGTLKGMMSWEAGKFVTSDGASFRALGSGQNPRGSRNEEARPDFILCDDLDDDEVCLNPARLDKVWDWCMGALFGCLSIEGQKRFVMVGNIIAKDSCIVRGSKVADRFKQVNLLAKTSRDLSEEISYHTKLQKEAKKAEESDHKYLERLQMALDYLKSGIAPSWWQRFSILEACYMIQKMGYRLSQREYFNNPLTEGKVFQKDWIRYDKIPKLSKMSYMLSYLDPGFKKTKTSDAKAWILMALDQGTFYIIKAFCGQASVNEMIAWGYELQEYLERGNAVAPMWMEELFLQDLLYDDFAAVAKAKNKPLPVQGDKRKKPDKDARITATSGHFERGNVIFNIQEEKNHHMQELVEQYLLYQPGGKSKKDGLDAVEGGMHKLQQMVGLSANVSVASRTKSKHKL